MKKLCALSALLAALAWSCSSDVEVHGIPKSIEITGCGDLIPGLPGFGVKDAGAE